MSEKFAVREWWHGGGRYGGAELEEQERRAAERGTERVELHILTPIRPASAPLGIVRKKGAPPKPGGYAMVCKGCGERYIATNPGKKWCGPACREASGRVGA